MPELSTPMDNQGYIQYYASDSLQVSDSLFTERDLINLGVNGGAVDSGAGCNISFDAFFNIDLNLDMGLFDFSLSSFDPSMFHKVDSLSLEMAAMNNMLIESILDMQCCDIAGAYNSTMVPFFQFFAEDGGFMTALVTYAEVITMIRAIMEPLECLMRLIPGNPWWPIDFDYLAWIYGYFKEAKPFMNRILSGEIIDIMLNPVHNMRVKMQACLGHGVPKGALAETFTEIGTADQLMAISKLAASKGSTITSAALPYMAEPTIPKPTDAIYIGGETNPLYTEHLAEYERKKVIYDAYIKNKATAEAELSRLSEAQKTTNRQLVLSSATQNALKLHTSGLCGCIADAFDINDFSISHKAIRTTSDLFGLDGASIAGVTNLIAGVTSTFRPAEEQYSVKKDDLLNNTTQAAIVEAGAGEGAPRTTIMEQDVKTARNPYAVLGVGGEVIETTISKGVTSNTPADPMGRLKSNDKAQDSIQKLYQDANKEQAAIDKTQGKYNTEWNAAKQQNESTIQQARVASDGMDKTSDAYKKAVYDLEMAVTVFNSYFKQFPAFDLQNDPMDQKAVSNYLVQDAFQEMFSPGYWEIPGANPIGTVADQVRLSINSSILARGVHFGEVSKSSMKRQALGQAVDLTKYNLMNNIASNVPTETRLEIPCTCDNLLCKIINYVIQYVLALFDKLIQQIINMIIQFLIPDWIRDLLRTLSDFLKCFLSAFNIFHTIEEIHHYSEMLLESLRGRINLYPEDPCFIPPEPFAPLDPAIPGSTFPGFTDTTLSDDDGESNDTSGGDTYIPAFPGPNNPTDPGFPGTIPVVPTGTTGVAGTTGTIPPIDPWTPPIILRPPVIIGQGDQGRPLPTFQLKCSYLEL